MYLRSIILVRGKFFSCTWGLGAAGEFVVRGSCVGISVRGGSV